MKYPKITEEAMVLWNRDHWSLAMIAKVFGVSRMGVKKYLNHRGINTSKDYREFWIKCLNCGKKKKVTRKRYRDHLAKYCSKKCFYEAIHNPNFVANRNGIRRARQIVSTFFTLEPEMVVHHIDSDERNNCISNLMVFACNGDHTKYHRRKVHRPKPLWDGSKHFG